MGKTWKLMKKLLPNKTSSIPDQKVIIDGKHCHDKDTIADEFNKMFNNVGTNTHNNDNLGINDMHTLQPTVPLYLQISVYSLLKKN